MTGPRDKHTKLANRLKVALALLCVGLVGLAIVSTFMYRKAEAVRGLSAYVSSGAIYNVSELFQIPVLMFFAILTLYAITELYRTYKAMNDPDTYRGVSSERVGISANRRTKREKSQKERQPVARKSRPQITDQSKTKRPRQITDQSKDPSFGLSASQISKPSSKPSKVGRTRGGPIR